MASIASAEQTTPVEITAPATNRAARILGPIAAGLAMLSAFATFVVLADLTPLAPTQNVVVTLLLINALTVFLLLGVIASEVWMVVQARRRGRAAARLHVRIVALFAVVAAVPTILVAVVASVTLDRGLDRLFSTRTKAIIENSLIVADAYLQEHAQMIRGDIMAMSFDVSRAKPLFDSDRERFK
jgi:two-component system nitrogen regulation sensor histidine kinase NtrY